MQNVSRTSKDSTIILVIVVPLIIFGYAMFTPHFAHSDHIAHIAIHEAGLLISGFLFSLALLGYNKTKLKRMLFSTAAFATLTVAQGVYLFSELNMSPTHMIDYFSVNGIFGILIVIMTVLFALGVFYNPRISRDL